MRHAALVAYLALVVAALIGAYRLETLGRSTNRALCSFKADLELRAASTRAILDEHPKEDPVLVFGLEIPRSQLLTNLSSQTRSLESLSSLDC